MYHVSPTFLPRKEKASTVDPKVLLLEQINENILIMVTEDFM